MTVFYAIDRSPLVVNGQGHPKIITWFNRTGRDGYVSANASAHKATKKEAEVLCKEWYGMHLNLAMAKGLV